MTITSPPPNVKRTLTANKPGNPQRKRKQTGDWNRGGLGKP